MPEDRFIKKSQSFLKRNERKRDCLKILHYPKTSEALGHVSFGDLHLFSFSQFCLLYCHSFGQVGNLVFCWLSLVQVFLSFWISNSSHLSLPLWTRDQQEWHQLGTGQKYRTSAWPRPAESVCSTAEPPGDSFLLSGLRKADIWAGLSPCCVRACCDRGHWQDFSLKGWL